MKKLKKNSLTFAIIIFLSASTTLSTLAQKIDYAGTLTTTITSDIMVLNPFTWGMANERDVIDHIYEPLVRRDVNHQPTPALCSDWEISSDYTNYNFTLRTN
ncbi:MAG: hypothetical protein H7641_08595, partial [Candidatus Heimdallarchaeota archaeon]|nr:hypothetical protein [Candidatus Heimdallarchaeota archaeon]MCK4877623.1 hypothetical protein [Candidatus Heimdallarchaeota archaeon]